MVRTKDEIRADLERRAKNNKAKWESMREYVEEHPLTDEECQKKFESWAEESDVLMKKWKEREKVCGRVLIHRDPPRSFEELLAETRALSED